MKSDTTTRKLKQAGIKDGIRVQLVKDIPERIPGQPSTRTGKEILRLRSGEADEAVLDELMKDKMGGMSTKELAEKYAISEGYVKQAFAKKFMNRSEGREILKGVLMQNAVACGMHLTANIDKLQPMQAAIATGIMTSRLIELEEHSATHKDPIDFAEIANIGKELKEIRDYANGGE